SSLLTPPSCTAWAGTGSRSGPLDRVEVFDPQGQLGGHALGEVVSVGGARSLGSRPDRQRPAAPVQLARAVLTQRRQVLRGGVALVLRPAERRVLLVPGDHYLVPFALGQH